MVNPPATFRFVQPLKKDIVQIQPGIGLKAESGESLFENPVYVNEPATSLFFSPGTGRLIADDVRLAAHPGCAITAYEISVARPSGRCSLSNNGCEFDGDCPVVPGDPQTCDPWEDHGFVVDTALYDGCPSSGGKLIPGTEASVELPENSAYVVVIELAPALAMIVDNVWVGVSFDRDGAGWEVGTPASVGFTARHFDIPIPGLMCDFSFSVPSIYDGFHARIACADSPLYEPSFRAYENMQLGDASWVIHPTGLSNGRLADDLVLAVDDCRLSSFAIGVQGNSPFDVQVELWEQCDPSTVIAGTQTTLSARGDGNPELLEFVPDAPIQLTGDTIYIAARFVGVNVGWLFDDGVSVGRTDPTFGIFDWPGQEAGCSWSFTGNDGGMLARVSCVGEAPVGACCRPGFSSGEEPTCTDGSLSDCSGPETRWRAGSQCDDEPFCPRCGVGACCVENDCLNVTSSECEKLDGRSWTTELCGINQQDCGEWICEIAEESCYSSLPEQRGCSDRDCCNLMCDVDPFCCFEHWDEVCASNASQLCQPGALVNAGVKAWINVDSGSIATNDCNFNGLPDECELDCDSSGIPDDCEPVTGPGDLPYEAMSSCFTMPCALTCASALYTAPCCARHDHDSNGSVDLQDFGLFQNAADY
ncbi:MAG: hypothetical protein ACPGXK_06285 [Phycisphaerae bacterium]